MTDPDRLVQRYKDDPIAYWLDRRRERRAQRVSADELRDLSARLTAQAEAPEVSDETKRALAEALGAVGALLLAYAADDADDDAFATMVGRTLP